MNILQRWAARFIVKKILKEVEKTVNSLFLKFSGKKSYLVAAATAVYAIAGAVAGIIDWKHALELILGAAGLGALRAGISKK